MYIIYCNTNVYLFKFLFIILFYEYIQARDAILDGTHPVTEELALQLAGIQTHIQFGNYCETKHRPPFLE